MRGDQLAWQWHIIRAIEANPKGLTRSQIAQRQETDFPTIFRDMRTLQTAWVPLGPQNVEPANRWTSIYTSKFRNSPPFIPNEESMKLKDFNLDAFMRHSFMVIHDELYTVKVRIPPDCARWVGEKIWHQSQKITKLSDDSLEITFRVAGLDEIKRWVLSFAPECQVLKPGRLKEIVREDLSGNLA